MTEPYIVEVWGRPVGVVVKQGDALRFHAVSQAFFALDGARFTTRGHARLAAARLELDQAREGAPALPSGRSLSNASHWASSVPCGS
jgi:hypothetical protein